MFFIPQVTFHKNFSTKYTLYYLNNKIHLYSFENFISEKVFYIKSRENFFYIYLSNKNIYLKLLY